MLGSIPATMKLVLSPGTMGSGEVFCHDGVGPCSANWTYIDAPGREGAVKGDKGVGHGADDGGIPPTRVWAV